MSEPSSLHRTIFHKTTFLVLLTSAHPSLCNELANSTHGDVHSRRRSRPHYLPSKENLHCWLWLFVQCSSFSSTMSVCQWLVSGYLSSVALQPWTLLHSHQELNEKKRKKADLLVQCQLWGSEELPGMLPGCSFWYSLLLRRGIS